MTTTTTTTTKKQRVGLIKDIHNARERLRRAKLALSGGNDITRAAAAQRVVDAQAALDALLHPVVAAAVAAAPVEAQQPVCPYDGEALDDTGCCHGCGYDAHAPIVTEPGKPVVTVPEPPAVPQPAPLVAGFTAAQLQQARVDRVHALRQRLHRNVAALGLDHPETAAAGDALAAAVSDAGVVGLTDAEIAELRAAAAVAPPVRPPIDEANDVEPRRGAWGALTASPERLAAPDEVVPTKPKRARKATSTTTPAAPASEYGRPGTAAELYRRSIMEGLSDEACFARVKAELGDKAAGKDTYPGWYRAQLRKNGKNPPVSPAASPKTNGTSN